MRSTTYGSGGILIRRPRLEAKLAGATGHPVTLLWGPPGTGKHTLLEEFLSRTDLPVWRARSVRNPAPAEAANSLLFRITESPDLGSTPDLSKFVEQWSSTPREGWLLLDGSELEPDQWRTVLPPDLVANAPPGLRLVLLARARPKLSLQKLQLAGRLLEIGPQDLRLESTETFELIAGTGITSLSTGSMETIHSLSRGWIAGVLLCALHVRSSPEPDRALSNLGDNPQLQEYLVQEILERLPAPLGGILVEMSVLRDPTTALCQAVLERVDAATLLAELADRLPLLENRGDGIWHLHPLLAAGLSAWSKARDPERYRTLHRRAARWSLVHGQAEATVRHALEARDPEILESVAERALQNLFRNSEFFDLQRHVRDLPATLAHDRPFLSLFLAWALFHMGREAEGVVHLDRARRLAREGAPAGKVEAILAHEAFLRSILLRLEGRFEPSLELASGAFEASSPRKPFLAASLKAQTAIGQFLSGRMDRARVELEEATARAEAAEHHLAYFGAGYTLAEILVLQGRTDLAHELLAAQRRRAETGSAKGRPVSGYLEIARSRLDLLEGNLARACETAEKGILLGRRCDNIRILNYGLAARAEIAALSGDLDGAARALDEAEAVARRTRMHWAIDLDELEAKRMRLLLARLPPSVLEAWLARTLPVLERPAILRWDLLRTALRLLTCLGRAEEARALGGIWRGFLESEGLVLPVLETEYALALACGFLGRRAEAAGWMDAALGKAAAMGVVGPFVHGPELDGIRREVLSDWTSRSGRADPARSALVARLSSPAPTGAKPVGSLGPRGATPLSERETEVLRAIRDGRSNREIADLLFVAESTVKTHLKNIFTKLKVSNRTRAVSLASEAGMI